MFFLSGFFVVLFLLTCSICISTDSRLSHLLSNWRYFSAWKIIQRRQTFDNVSSIYQLTPTVISTSSKFTQIYIYIQNKYISIEFETKDTMWEYRFIANAFSHLKCCSYTHSSLIKKSVYVSVCVLSSHLNGIVRFHLAGHFIFFIIIIIIALYFSFSLYRICVPMSPSLLDCLTRTN